MPVSPNRVLKSLFLMVLVVFFSAQNAHAADPLLVTDIKVDVSADNAAVARDKAIVDGQRLAFQKLCEQQQITPPNLSDNQIANLVRDFSVQNEKTSATRYVATLSYRFRSGATKNILANAGAQFAPTDQEQSSSFQSVIAQTAQGAPPQPSQASPDENDAFVPVEAGAPNFSANAAASNLIVPVFDRGTHPILFENPNPWRNAWQRVAQNGGNIVVPSGNADDVQELSGPIAVSMNPDILNAARARYNANAIWIVRAGVLSNVQGAQQLNIAYSELTAAGQGPIGTFALDGTGLLSTEQLFDAGVKEMMRRMGVSPTPNATSGAASSFTAFAPLVNLQDVNQIPQKLTATGLFDRVDVISVSRSGMRLQMQSHYDITTLKAQLAGKNIQLMQSSKSPDLQLNF